MAVPRAPIADGEFSVESINPDEENVDVMVT